MTTITQIFVETEEASTQRIEASFEIFGGVMVDGVITFSPATGGDVDLIYNEETQQLEVVKLSTGMRGPMGGSGL